MRKQKTTVSWSHYRRTSQHPECYSKRQTNTTLPIENHDTTVSDHIRQFHFLEPGDTIEHQNGSMTPFLIKIETSLQESLVSLIAEV